MVPLMIDSIQTAQIPALIPTPALIPAVANTAFTTVRRAFTRPLSLRAGVRALALTLCALCGLHAMAAVTPSPTSLSWASVPVGGKGAQKVVTLTNSGSAAISISSIAFSGTNPNDFQIFSKTCSTSLAASASCTVNVVFAPSTSGTRSAPLNFTDNGSGSPHTMGVSGLGTSTTGSVAISPSALSFGTLSIGSSSVAQSATLSNGLTSAVTISSIAISGTNAGDFSIASQTCGTSLAASANCTASIVFKPTAAGTRTATLSFADSATNSPQTVALAGTDR